ncbi:MAG: NTP transferase domain-containing protein [Nostoc sp.]|uniref:NTP transferase domain-containing protein n=1 Tax=Nostoc sp. TaxID=1180 RepID=UPI002FEFC591
MKQTEAVGMIGVLILAAGASTRLGKPKQLLQYRGQSFLRHTAKMAIALTFPWCSLMVDTSILIQLILSCQLASAVKTKLK